MTTQDIATATPLQLRRMVAEALGWQPIPQAHGESITGFPPNEKFIAPFPIWDADLASALGLVYEFDERRKQRRIERSNVYMRVEILRDLSGDVKWSVGCSPWEPQEWGVEDFDFATVDGPVAICRAFLAAIAALEESQKEDEVTA